MLSQEGPRRVEAETRNAHTLLRADNYEEALQAASQLFELCVEADFQARPSKPVMHAQCRGTSELQLGVNGSPSARCSSD